MLEFLNPNDAITLLKHDHQVVKDLFEQFEKAETRREKMKLSAEAIKELQIHADIEEKIFYAAVRPRLEKNIMNEADEEHHVAKVLIAELSAMNGSEDHYDAKFHVLAENIRHHIREEEGEMMPKARALDIDFGQLGEQLLARKEGLMKNGIPETSEDLMIAKAGISDSPARHSTMKKSSAQRKKATPIKSGAKKVVKLLKMGSKPKPGVKAKSTKNRKSVVAMKRGGRRMGQRAAKRA